jgi:transcriptional regulator with XRE-family HTH domain
MVSTRFEQVMNGSIAATLTRERAARGYSIDQLAQKAAISSGLLSQLERGIGNPSLSTLHHLAQALEIPIGSFFATDASEDIVVHPQTRKRLVLSDSLTYELLVPDLRGALSMFYIELPAHFSNMDAPFRHAGEEAEFVLEGSLEAHVGDRTLDLDRGDSIRFASSMPHWFRTYGARCILISAQTPPSF